MSVILDALKKLDREKSSRRSATANIAVEILSPDLPRPGKRIPLYAAIALLASIATAAITYSVNGEGWLSVEITPSCGHKSSCGKSAGRTGSNPQ